MPAACPSWAGGQAILAGLALAFAGLTACTSAPTPEPAASPEVIQSAGNASPERPEFYVQWKAGLPGVTQRPAPDASNKLPAYPQSAIRNNETGTTTLEGCVTVEGRMVDVKIARSSGSTTLDEATLAWAKAAKYRPAEFNGEPFAVCGYRFDYEWRVNIQ